MNDTTNDITDETAPPRGALVLIPVALGETPWPDFLPATAQQRLGTIRHFVVENARAARAQLKRLDFPGALRDTDIRELAADAHETVLDTLLAPALHGEDIGLMSDAGCPAIADPGARLVARAHALGLRVVPQVGPSSILLALMGSGLNGQRFAFHGYLPVADAERDHHIRALEDESRRRALTQIFIETPYRNERLFAALLRVCQARTRLCLARDLTTADEYLRTRNVADWKRAAPPPLARRPALFLLLA
ncbi:MAG: SAM-dependent methyltransferase [Azoarcus sp.]|jgi:16S rRNA (cytidine1402-2'-O)-methyltransferase|nr:SAM-dependent methyltransferase [Azoarcus sp.]